MKLIWHIVLKDLRRLWLPLSLWLLLTLAHTALLGTYYGDNQIEAGSFEGLRYFAGTWGLVVLGIGFVLAAWLVMEDSLVSAQSFWTTRPISGARLLAAKILGAVVMFSLAPVLVLTPVWLGCGFSLPEFARAARELAVMQGVVSIAAFVIAGVTATSGQFLMRAVGAAVLLPVGVSFLARRETSAAWPISTGIVVSQDWLGLVLLLATPILVIIHQYLTRRTRRTWALGGLGFGLMLAVPFLWKWDISSLVQPGLRQEGGEPVEFRAVTLVTQQGRVVPSLASPERRQLRLEGNLSGVPANCYLRLESSLAEWVTPNERIPLYRRLRAPAGFGRPPEILSLQVAGLRPDAADQGPTPWMLEGEELNERVERARAAGYDLGVTLKLTLMRGEVLGELPLRVGAEIRADACVTRIIGIVWSDEGLRVRLEDRDFSPFRPFGSTQPGADVGLIPARGGEDTFVVVHQASPAGQGTSPDGQRGPQIQSGRMIGALQANSILIGQRELVLAPPTREVNGRTEEIPDWEKDTIIKQVRFRPTASIRRHLAVTPFSP